MTDASLDAAEVERRERLRWLGALRWWAMTGAVVGAIMAAALDWSFVVPEGIAAGVVLGVVVNGVLLLRAGRARAVGPSELSLHSVADAMALTWLLAFSGGLANPISAAYSFHVVLGALLSGRTGALVAGAASTLGVASLFLLEAFSVLPSSPLVEIPSMLRLGALAILLLGLSYFALVLAARLREGREVVQAEKDRAEQSLALLFESLDALHVGIEVMREHEAPLRNRFAEDLLGQVGDHAVHSPEKMTFVDAEGDSRIIETVKLSSVGSAKEASPAILWVDRTDQLVVEQRHIMLERLATLGRALQGVAHELNTPLMTMQTLARDLLAALEDVPLTPAQRADIQESTEILVDEARRCRALTQGLLATAHPESPRLNGHSAAEIVTRAARLVGDSGRRVDVDADSLAPILAREADRVLQVLMNLIQNALQASPDAERAVVTVRGEALPSGDFALRVQDRGEGIPPHIRERLFEPFVTTRASGEGTGLGLYTSLRIANDLGGSLALDPGPEGGTIATLILPAHLVQRSVSP